VSNNKFSASQAPPPGAPYTKASSSVAPRSARTRRTRDDQYHTAIAAVLDTATGLFVEEYDVIHKTESTVHKYGLRKYLQKVAGLKWFCYNFDTITRGDQKVLQVGYKTLTYYITHAVIF